MRTAEQIEENKAQRTGESSDQLPKQVKRKLPAKMVEFCWKKGQSGNPGGRPKSDFAAEFARKILEAKGDEKLLNEYANGFVSQLRKGNAYTFKELAERGFGKLKEIKEVTHRYEDVPDADLDKRLTELIHDLGLAQQIDEAGASGTAGRAEKTNGKAQDHAVLP